MANIDKRGQNKRFKRDHKQSGSYDKNRGRGRTDSDRDGEKVTVQNDITWYAGRNAELLESAGRLSFCNALGQDFHRTSQTDLTVHGIVDESTDVLEVAKSGKCVDDASVPGICALYGMPAMGVSTSPNSPLNVASRRLFSYLQSTLSMKLAPAIEAPDVTVYLCAADSLIGFYGWMLRIYRTIPVANALNKYWGREALTAQGLNAQDIIHNQAEIRYWIQWFQHQFNESLFVPKEFGFAKRHFWLYANYFKDSPVVKAQTYMHVPVGLYQWDPTGDEHGTQAKFVRRPKIEEMTWSELRSFGESLLSAMLQDQDAISISGFMLRGYGTDGCFKLPDLPVDDFAEPAYSEEILGQIHNSYALGLSCSQDEWDDWEEEEDFKLDFNIRQKSGDDSWLYSKPVVSLTGEWSDKSEDDSKTAATAPKADWPHVNWPNSSIVTEMIRMGVNQLEHVMDSFVDNPNAAEVVINSRNMITTHVSIINGQDHDTDPVLQAEVLSMGLDLIWAYKWIFLVEGNLAYVMSGTAVARSATYDVMNLDLITKFDWAPRILVAEGTADTDQEHEYIHPKLTLHGDIWDYNNATHVSESALAKLHEAALLGAFDLAVVVNAYKH